MKIKNLQLIPSDGTKDNSFVGIKINNNQIEFHFPKTYVLSDDDNEKRKNILNILRTISLAKKTTNSLSSYNSKTNNGNEFPLGSYLWIISDYLKYGKYENKEKVYSPNIKGKINWKRTIKSSPIISKGNLIYTDIVYERNDQKDNLLTEIYNCCVKKAIDDIGWIYNLQFDTNGIDFDRLLNKKRELYISAINTEISHTFEDTKKNRLMNMKNIIFGLDDKMIETKELVYGVDSYETIYEKMVDSMFSNISNIKDFYPSATWMLKTEKDIKDSSNLRPDTILIKDKKVYILDAKYYRFGLTFNVADAPTTDSIQKQITYGEYIKKVKEGEYDDVFNAFVMPYSRTNNPKPVDFHEIMEFVGIATAKWNDANEANHRKIVAILLDTNYLIDNWARRNEDNLNKIIDIIEKHVEGIIINE